MPRVLEALKVKFAVEVIKPKLEPYLNTQLFFNYEEFASDVILWVAQELGAEALATPQDRIRFGTPMFHTCSCPAGTKIIRHEFGRGSRCMVCGLPA